MERTKTDRVRYGPWLALGLLLAVYFAVVLFSSARLSAAGDELLHVRAGAAYLTQGRYIDEHAAWWTRVDPLTPLADVVPGALAMASGMPADTRAEIDIPYRHVRAARWANHLAGALVLLVLFAWGRAIAGPAGGLLAAAMCMGHPLFLAHATIVSSDMYAALGMVALFAAAWWAWLAPRGSLATHGPKKTASFYPKFEDLNPLNLDHAFASRSWKPLALIAIVGWLALTAKISNLFAVAFLPIFALTGCWTATNRVGARRRAIVMLISTFEVLMACLLISFLLLCSYVFTDSHLPWEPVIRAFSLAESRDPWIWCNGIWNMAGPKLFLKVLALKSPVGWGLAAVIGTLATLTLGLKKRTLRPMLLISIITATIYAYFITRGFYLGLRHLLGPICLTSVLVAPAARLLRARGKAPRALAVALCFCVAASLVASIAATPDHLAYFNMLAGKPPVMVDTDGDWGQGLIALDEWQEKEAGDEKIWLAYFGAAKPENYGVNYAGLPSPYGWAHEDWRPPGADAIEPGMLSGWVAISATHLIGPLLPSAGLSREYYAAFRELEPVVVLREAIFIYDLRKTGGRTPTEKTD